MNSNHNFTVGYKIWLDFMNGSNLNPVIGEKKIELLRSIIETGSIHSAAEELGLDFKKAHDMLLSLQEKMGENILYHSERGRQGGTQISLFGRSLVEMYDKINTLFDEFKDQVNELLSDESNFFSIKNLEEVIH